MLKFKKYLPFILLLTGCHSVTSIDKNSELHHQLIGIWQEILPSDTSHYIEADLKIEFLQDSVFIEEHRKTSASNCETLNIDTICSNLFWSNFYKGDYSLDSNLLTLQFVFQKTTANAVTSSRRMENGKVYFKYELLKDSTGEKLSLSTNIGSSVFVAYKNFLSLKKL